MNPPRSRETVESDVSPGKPYHQSNLIDVIIGAHFDCRTQGDGVGARWLAGEFRVHEES